MNNNSLSEMQSELVAQNVGYARKLAQKFHNQRNHHEYDLEDYEAAAMLGLCDAARRYDPSRELKFQTFVFLRIRGAMYDLLRYGGGVPRNYYNRMMDAKAQNEENKGVPATSMTGKSANETHSDDHPKTFASTATELAHMIHSVQDVNFQVYVTYDGKANLTYRRDFSPEQITLLKATRKYVHRMVERLPAKQKEVIYLRYFQDKSFKQISHDLGGKSKSWVSRLHCSGLKRLRNMISIEELRAFEVMQ